MNRRVSTLLAALGLTVLGTAAPAGAQKFWKDVPIPAMREFQIPKPEVYTLKNGLRVFLLEDHTLPRVRASMLVRTGSVWEPADKVGLAGITGAAMRTGGSVNRKGEQIDELLEGLGASVETRIDNDSATATMFTLSRDVEVGLDVLADVVQHPPAIFALARSEKIARHPHPGKSRQRLRQKRQHHRPRRRDRRGHPRHQ